MLLFLQWHKSSLKEDLFITFLLLTNYSKHWRLVDVKWWEFSRFLLLEAQSQSPNWRMNSSIFSDLWWDRMRSIPISDEIAFWSHQVGFGAQAVTKNHAWVKRHSRECSRLPPPFSGACHWFPWGSLHMEHGLVRGHQLQSSPRTQVSQWAPSESTQFKGRQSRKEGFALNRRKI